MNAVFHLVGHILDCRADGPPARRLRLLVRLDNPAEQGLALLSTWTDASFDPGGTAAGAGFEQQHPQALEAIIPSRGHLAGEFHVPTSSELLANIERNRIDRQRSGEVNLSLRTRFVVAPIQGVGGADVLASPREVVVRDLSDRSLSYVISQSDWIQLLRAWRWSEIELFELALDERRESPQFRRAYQLLRSAEDRLRTGDYGGVLQNCRQALESLAKDTVPDASTAAGFEALLALRVTGEKMRQRLDALLRSLSSVAHLGRHEERPFEDLNRDDALLVLRCTLAAVHRLAGSQ